MRRYAIGIILLIPFVFVAACAYAPPDRYNTQRGAAIGAGAGALIGQAIGHNTGSTLIGLAAGTIFGALVGNAIDQDYQAMRDAVRLDKPVVYYDRRGSAVEAIPEGVDERTDCRKITKRVWKNGELISETVEEICDDLDRYYPPPPYIFSRYYPRVYFHHGYYPRPYYRYRWYPYRHHWYCW